MTERIRKAILRDGCEQQRLLPAVGLFDELTIGVGKDARVVDLRVEQLGSEADEIRGCG